MAKSKIFASGLAANQPETGAAKIHFGFSEKNRVKPQKSKNYFRFRSTQITFLLKSKQRPRPTSRGGIRGRVRQ